MTLTIFVGPSIVIKHGTLGNLRAKWALKSEHHLTKWVIFQLAMFDYQRFSNIIAIWRELMIIS